VTGGRWVDIDIDVDPNFHAGPKLRKELGMKTRLGSVVGFSLKMLWCVLGIFRLRLRALFVQIVILVWFVKQIQVMEFGKSLFCLRLALPKQGWTSRTVWRKGPNHHWCLTACPCLHTPSWSTNSGFAMRQMHYRKKGGRERERCTCLLLWCGFVGFSEKCGSVKGIKIHSFIAIIGNGYFNGFRGSSVWTPDVAFNTATSSVEIAIHYS
jgi:hypothetical protein